MSARRASAFKFVPDAANPGLQRVYLAGRFLGWVQEGGYRNWAAYPVLTPALADPVGRARTKNDAAHLLDTA